MTTPGRFASPLWWHEHTNTVSLAIIASIVITILCVPGWWWVLAGLSVIAGGLLLSLLSVVFAGRTDVILLGWILIFPLGYCYLSYPIEHSLVTLDRVFLALLFITACWVADAGNCKIPLPLRKSGLCWVVFLLFAALAIPRARTPLNSLRVWLEALLFPGLLCWRIICQFDVRKHVVGLHYVTCIMAIYVACIGMAEVALQRDLLPIPSGDVIVAGDYGGDPRDAATQILIRPNGPFSTVNSFAIVGIVNLCFLLFLKRAIPYRMATGQKMLHRVAVAAAFAETVMPLFKSVLITLVLMLLVNACYEVGRRKLRAVGVAVGLVLGLICLRMILPVVFEERADPFTFYARIAQEKQTLALFKEHPVNGVGLNNFYEAAQSRDSAGYRDAEALDTAHNNFGAVLAETGLTGFVPFLMSQILIVGAYRRIYKKDSKELTLVWKTFLFLFLAFSINGLSLTIIYFGDANLWYMCVMGIIYKFGITSQSYGALDAPPFRPTLGPNSIALQPH